MVLIRLTPHHWQSCISQVCDITKNKLYINTGSLGLKFPVAQAKFSDLVVGHSLLPGGNFVSRLREFLENYAFSDVTKLQNAELPMVRGQTD